MFEELFALHMQEMQYFGRGVIIVLHCILYKLQYRLSAVFLSHCCGWNCDSKHCHAITYVNGTVRNRELAIFHTAHVYSVNSYILTCVNFTELHGDILLACEEILMFASPRNSCTR